MVACASDPDKPLSEPAADFERGTDCIFQATVRDYEVLDNSNLVVTATGRKKYHVRLSRPAFALGSTWGIGFNTRLSQICPGTADIVLSGSLEPETVPIAGIRSLSEDDYDNLLIRFGEKVPEQTKTPPDSDIEGAEVEELD
jgi:hypothetical protein